MFWRLFCLCLFFIQKGSCFPEGAPVWSCADGQPHHGAEAQTKASPFTLTASQTQYSTNTRITLTLSSPSGAEFEGFLIRVQRTAGDTEECVGAFVDNGPKIKELKYHHASPTAVNCVTHKEEEHFKEMQVTWMAPTQSVGQVKARATAIKGFQEFWTDVSVIINPDPNDSNINLGTPSSTVNSVFGDFSLEACGTMKGCALYPKDCSGTSCRRAVTWEPRGANVLFEVMADTDDEYVALGFSKDDDMDDTDTVHCIATNDATPVLNIQHGYNGHDDEGEDYNERHRITGFSSLSVKRSDGRLYCWFLRPTQLSYYTYENDQQKDLQFNLGDTKYKLFVATGPVFRNSDAANKHNQLPAISREMINFSTDKGTFEMTTVPLYIKIHGSLGMVSWTAMAAFGMFLARHYRSALGNKCCGTGAWFQMHRGVMIFTTLLCATTIGVIFGFVQEWTHSATVHAIFGLASLALALFQVGIGMARPGLQSKDRRVFNWIHRITGVAAFIIAAVAVLLGGTNVLIDRTVARYELIVLLTWLGFYLLMEIILEIVKFCASEDPEKPGNSSSKNCALLVVLGFIGVVILVFLAIAIAFLVRA